MVIRQRQTQLREQSNGLVGTASKVGSCGRVIQPVWVGPAHNSRSQEIGHCGNLRKGCAKTKSLGGGHLRQPARRFSELVPGIEFAKTGDSRLRMEAEVETPVRELPPEPFGCDVEIGAATPTARLELHHDQPPPMIREPQSTPSLLPEAERCEDLSCRRCQQLVVDSK